MRVLKIIGVVVLVAGVGTLAYQARVQAAAEARQPAAGDNAHADGYTPPAKNKESAVVNVHVFNKQGQLVGPVASPRVEKSDEEWLKQLGRPTYEVVRAKGTERPFCGTLLDNKKHGVYACVGCGLPLFSSNAKFNSGTGWPSFFKPVGEGNVVTDRDVSHGMVRDEILCARCDGHLGHVFEDGPPPTGLRFCVNSESLKFVDEKDLGTLADPVAETASTQPVTKPASGATAAK